MNMFALGLFLAVATPLARAPTLVEAREAARVEPGAQGWRGAIQEYVFSEGAVFVVYAAPGQVTDIMLEPGEILAGDGPIAAGDTDQWVIGDTVSGAGTAARTHILIKPLRAGLRTSAVINTSRRTYFVELVSTPRAWMTAVTWRHPQAAAPISFSPPTDSGRVYRIEGEAPFRPSKAWDDGRRVVIEFSPAAAEGELPPLFVLDRKGRPELVNYRVRDRWMIVDRLFTRAELRLGGKGDQQSVRVLREDKP